MQKNGLKEKDEMFIGEYEELLIEFMKSKEKILKLEKEEIYEMLGIEISMRRSKCALLALLALQNALSEKLRTWSSYLI